MEDSCLLKEVKDEIEEKRSKLNQMILVNMDRDEVLKYSVELDRLIDKYYYLELNKNRAER